MVDPLSSFFVISLAVHNSNPIIPDAFFSTNVEDQIKLMKLKLTSDAFERTWEVKLNGREFAGGWEDFSAAHCLRDDDVLVFRHVGDMTFHVTPSGRSFSQKQCISSNLGDSEDDDGNDDDDYSEGDADDIDDDDDETWDDDSDSKNIASKKKPRTVKQSRTEAKSSSENSYLVAHVTSSNLSRDRLCLLRGFARSNGLNERCCEIDLMNQHGQSWTLGLRYNRTTDQACISGGWRNFCYENGLEAGSFYKFKLVRNETKSFSLRLCSNTNSAKPSSERASTKQNKFLRITYKPYMLKSGQLRLPKPFVIENGIQDREIILMDKNGVKWPSNVASVSGQGGFYMAKGWRSFCAANGFKTGQSFTLEFVRGEDTTTPMLKFCSNVKREQEPFDDFRGTVQSSRDEEEEAQEETETRFQKRTRVSAEGASSKSSADPLESCSISVQVTKVKQSIVETLAGVRQFRSELEIKKQSLEASLQEIIE